MRTICFPVWLRSFRRGRTPNTKRDLLACKALLRRRERPISSWCVTLLESPSLDSRSSATGVTRATEYRRAAVLIRRLPAELLTLYRSVEPASVTVVTLEGIGRAVELRRFERTRRAAGAAIVVEIGVSVLGEDIKELGETPLTETPAFRH